MSLDKLLEIKENREQDALRVICHDITKEDYMIKYNLSEDVTEQYIKSGKKWLYKFDTMGDLK